MPITKPNCAACGEPGVQGGHGYLVKLKQLVWDKHGKEFPPDSEFHGYHTFVVGPVYRKKLQIPDEVKEMTVTEMAQLEREYQSG